MRQNLRFFLLATLAAVALRLLFLLRFPAITADSLIYGDIAKNWLLHGVYGITAPQGVEPTFIRLPGYPAFLATIFAIFGVENYRAAMAVQVAVDLTTCFLIADMARRLASARAAKAAFLFAGLCPFFANYAAAALTETLEIFFTALALDLALAGIEQLPSGRMRPWLGCGMSVGAAILLRPDGGLLLVAIGSFLVVMWIRSWLDRKWLDRKWTDKNWLGKNWMGKSRQDSPATRPWHIVRATLVLIAALAPLIPWALRNQRTFHRFQPLAPRYANEENEFVPAGFNRWVKTWMADYVSVEEIHWAVPGSEIDGGKLPARAFDSAPQEQETLQLLADYNAVLHISPALDRRFADLAEVRVRANPLRYYLWLPLVRIVDMWLRPRTELLPSDTRWWEFNDDPKWSALAVALGVIGLLYVGAALAGSLRVELSGGALLLLLFLILRSAFLGSLENPEPRYTLECYPVLLSLGGALFR